MVSFFPLFLSFVTLWLDKIRVKPQCHIEFFALVVGNVTQFLNLISSRR